MKGGGRTGTPIILMLVSEVIIMLVSGVMIAVANVVVLIALIIGGRNRQQRDEQTIAFLEELEADGASANNQPGNAAPCY